MSEQILKKRIFKFMIASKILVLLYLVYRSQIGGFNNIETESAISLIIPLFSVYLTVMLSEYINNRNKTKSEKKIRLNSTFVTTTYFLFPVYVLTIIFMIYLKSNGTITFSHFQRSLTSIESGLGVYVGLIVFGLFKKKDDSPT